MSQKMQDHPFGKPISILSVSNSNKFVKESDELDKIFNHPEIQDRKVVILSLVGAFRGGKSSFLDYCLRFLYAHFPSINNPTKVTKFIFEKNEEWMGNPDEPLSGFSWSAGTDRNTYGIIMWSDVFLYTMDQTGEKIAIFIMDTQGLFDSQSTPTDNSRILTIGTLISSLQILNLKHQIHEDQLQYLQFAAEFAKFCTKNKDEPESKPFQNLTFLIRDWENEEEFEFGLDEGKKYIENVLMIKPSQREELKSVRETIVNCFEEIKCCLLPHPGKIVAGRRSYNGCWSSMDEDFKAEMKTFIEYLLLPENMKLKKVNSREITVKEMRQFSQGYLNSFELNEVSTTTMYELTVESHMNNIVESCIDNYKLTIYRNADLLTEQNIQIVHEQCMKRALEMYDKETKMGTVDHEQKYKAKLEMEIVKNFDYFKDQNDQKFQVIEKEKVKQQAALAKEKQQRLEAEEARKDAEINLKQLELKRNQMDAAEYEKQRIMFENRERAEQIRLENFETRSWEETSFRQIIIMAINAVLTITSFTSVGMETGLAAMNNAAAFLTAAKTTMQNTASVHNCSIM